MLTIDSKLLVGMLTDLLKSTADDTLPALHAVKLFTADHHGEPVLVGVSTDRYTVAQAHESAAGELPSILLPVPAVKTVISALRGDKGSAVLTVADGEKLIVEATSASTTVALLLDTPFPRTEVFFTDDEPTCVPGLMQFRADVLSAVVAVAKRRKVDMSIRYFSIGDNSAAKPSQILIGANYRAVVMPLKGNPDWTLLAAPVFVGQGD